MQIRYTYSTSQTQAKIKLFGQNNMRYFGRINGENHSRKIIVSAVKHGGGSVMFWIFFVLKILLSFASEEEREGK